MYSVKFDTDDSFIFNGDILYFEKKENIIPFIKKCLIPHKAEIKTFFNVDINEYIQNYPSWYIDKIETID